MIEQEREGSEPAPPPAEAAPPVVVEAPALVIETPAVAIAAPVAIGEPAGAPAGDRPRGDGGERRRRPFGRRKVCTFCVEKVKDIDYKDAIRLRRYVSDRGRIESRRKTGTCAKHQRWLATALKRARHLALLPYSPEHVRNLGAPMGSRR